MWNVKRDIANIDECDNGNMHRRQVFASCDSNYFNKYAEYFLASINLNSPGIKVVLEVINPEASFAEKIEAFRKRFKAIGITAITTNASLRFCSHQQKLAFYTCNRFMTLSYYMKKNLIPTMFLDIDCFIKKDLSQVFYLYREVDMALFTRLHRDVVSRKLLAGSIFFNANTAIISFLERLAGNLSGGNLEWYKDQENLFLNLVHFSGILKVADLKKEFVDFDFDDNSTIWTGKGERKDNDKKYIAYEKFLDKYLGRKEADTAIYLPLESADYNEAYIFQHYRAKALLEALVEEKKNAEIVLVTKTEDASGAMGYSTVYKPEFYLDGKTSIEYLKDKKISVKLADKVVALPNIFAPELEAYFHNYKANILPPEFLTVDSHNNDLWKKKKKRGMLEKRGRYLKELFLKYKVVQLKDSYFHGKSVALVGNGKSLLDAEFGEEIDKHDIIIRFNLGYPLTASKKASRSDIPSEHIQTIFRDERVFPPEEHIIIKNTAPDEVIEKLTNVKSTGRRTTMWVCATIDQSRQEVYSNVFKGSVFVWPHLTSLANIHKKLLGKNLKRLSKSCFEQFKGCEVKPSSGLLLFACLKDIKKLKSLDLYGFDFFESGHQVRMNELLLNKKEKFPHSKDFEKNYITDAAGKDNRITLRFSKDETIRKKTG